MEFTEGQVAALTLGYLKEKGLSSIADEFLQTCPYLGENSIFRNGKYVVTRVAGLRLADFLEQYALIYKYSSRST